MAVLWSALLISWVIATETPTGNVKGTVAASDTGRAIANAEVVLSRNVQSSSPQYTTQSVKTDLKGEFAFNDVAVGSYKIEAYAKVHTIQATSIDVSEGKTSIADLEAIPNEPYIHISGRQRSYTSSEKPEITLDGFTKSNHALVKINKVKTDKLFSGDADLAQAVIRDDPEDSSTPAALPVESSERFDIAITKRDSEGSYRQKVTFAPHAPGLYRVIASADGITFGSWLSVTDVGLITKESASDVLAYTVTPDTGAVVAQSDVFVFQDKKLIAKGLTDASGVWRTHLPSLPQGEERQRVIMARRGQSIAFLTSDSYDDESRDISIYAYTERPVYRPGHTVRFRGIVRKFADDKYNVPHGQVRVEVHDRRNTLVYSGDLTLSRFGTFHSQFNLPEFAATGNYEIICKYGGQEESVSFSVAEYRKPEFTVSVEPAKKRYIRGDVVKVKIHADYFFGAPVVGATVQYSVSRSDYWMSPESQEDYGNGGDDEGEYQDYGGYGEEVRSGTATTGPDGSVWIEFTALWNQGKDDYYAVDQQFTISATVTDQSRAEADGEGTTIATNGDIHLDVSSPQYMANKGESARFTIKATDYDNKPRRGVIIDVNANLNSWEDNEERYDQIASDKVTTDVTGRATFAFKPTKEGSYTVRAACRDSGGRLIKSATWLWVPGNGEFQGYKYPNLKVILDKKTYNPGDTAKVLINSSQVGQMALLTIEGRRLYDHKLVKLANRSTVVEIPIKPGYQPNFYVNVCYVKDKKFASDEAHAKVSLADRTIKLTVTADKKKYEPGDIATYHVKAVDSHGKPLQAEVSLGVVDEAIYDLMEDQTPPIVDSFYAHQWNHVQTNYSFPEVYYSGDKAGFVGTVRKEFVDTAFWRADLVTDANGEARASFKMPDNLTTWRATARACTMDTAVGETTSKVICSKKLLVRLETPRFLVQGDQCTISAIVHNYLPSRQNVLVALTAPGLSIDGDTSARVSVDSSGMQRVDWQVKAGNPGVVMLTAYASGQGASDAMQLSIPVRPHGQRIVETRTGSTAGTTATESFVVRSDSVPGAGEVRLRLSPSLASSLLGSLDYLAQYPYGCTEQTMSCFLPDVILWKSLKTMGIQDYDLKKRLPDMVGKGLDKLYDFQHEDSGGWGWCQYDKDDQWMTSYVVFGLLTARDAGFAVNMGVIDRGVASLKKQVAVPRTFKYQIDAQRYEDERLYALYVLSTAGKNSVVTEYLPDTLRNMKPDPYRDALAVQILANIGDTDRAKGYLDRLWSEAITAGNEIHWERSRYYWDEADTDVTAQAMMAIQRVTPADPRLQGVVQWLMGRRYLNHWYSTRDTAMILYAMSAYLSRTHELAPKFIATLTFDGRPVGKLSFDKSSLFKPEPELVIRPNQPGRIVKASTIDRLLPGNHQIRISMAGQGKLYYTVQLTQYVQRRENAHTTTDSGITITRTYHKMVSRWSEPDKMNRLLPADNAIDDFHSGDSVHVKLIVHSAKKRYHVLVEDYLPAGCEPFDRGRVEIWEWTYWWVDQDVRDERVSFYVDELPVGRSILEYDMRAGTPGTFHALPTLVEAMYDPAISAYGNEDTVTIR